MKSFLKKQEINQLINKITNPVVAAITAVFYAIESKSKSAIRERVKSFFNVLFAMDKEKLQKSYSQQKSPEFETFFEYLSSKELYKYLSKYFGLLDTALHKKPLEAIQKSLSILTSTRRVRDKENKYHDVPKYNFPEKDSLMKELYLKGMRVLIQTNGNDDGFALKVLKFAKKNNNVKLKELVNTYSEYRFARLEEPLTLSDIHVDTSGKIMRLPGYYPIGHNALIIASERLERRHFWSDEKVKLPRIVEGDEDHCDISFRMVCGLYKAGQKNNSYMFSTLDELSSTTEYRKNKQARKMVTSLVTEKLLDGSIHTKNVEEYKKLLDSYYATRWFPKEVIRQGILKHLSDGNIENADTISSIFNYSIDSDLVQEAQSAISHEIGELLTNTNSYLSDEVFSSWISSSDEFKISENFTKAVKLQERISLLKNYLTNGLPTLDDIPVIDFEEGYYGKFMLFTFRDKLFVRTLTGLGRMDDMHKDIVKKTNKEISGLGFADYAQELRGAHMTFADDEKVLLLRDRSIDFGECDKEVVKELLQPFFPEHEIRIRKAEH